MAFALSDVRNLVRYIARNAADSTSYPDIQVDISLQFGGDEWMRQTHQVQASVSVACAAASSAVPTIAADFLPERLIDAWLSYSGQLIRPELAVTDIASVLRAQLIQNCGSVTGTPPTGQPTMMGFSSQSAGQFDFLCQYAYSLNVVYWQQFTAWTPGDDSNTSMTFNLPDDALRCISRAAAGYMQFTEPDNAQRAQALVAAIEKDATRFYGRGAGGRGAGVYTKPTRGC